MNKMNYMSLKSMVSGRRWWSLIMAGAVWCVVYGTVVIFQVCPGMLLKSFSLTKVSLSLPRKAPTMDMASLNLASAHSLCRHMSSRTQTLASPMRDWHFLKQTNEQNQIIRSLCDFFEEAWMKECNVWNSFRGLKLLFIFEWFRFCLPKIRVRRQKKRSEGTEPAMTTADHTPSLSLYSVLF